MTLREWLAESRMTVAAAALALGLHRTTVHAYVRREKTPRPAVVRRIESLTAGAVGPADLLPESGA